MPELVAFDMCATHHRNKYHSIQCAYVGLNGMHYLSKEEDGQNQINLEIKMGKKSPQTTFQSPY